MIDGADFVKWLEVFNVPYGSGGGGDVTERQVQQLAFNYALDTGIANAYIANLSPTIVSFTESLPIYMKAIHTNTSASTLTVNGTTKPIVLAGNNALVGGEILVNNIYEFLYNSTYNAFVLINPAAQSFAWTVIAGTTQTAVANNGYIIGNAALTSVLLPAVANPGNIVQIVGRGAGGWVLTQNAGQTVHIGSVASTAGTGGSIASENQYDAISLVCIIANTTWALTSGAQGNLTIV